MRRAFLIAALLASPACRTTSPTARVKSADLRDQNAQTTPTMGFIVAASCLAGGYYGSIRLVARDAPSGNGGAELEYERFKGPDGDGEDMPKVFLRGEQVKSENGGKAWDFGSHLLTVSPQVTDGKLHPGVFTAKAMAGEGEGDAEVVDCELAP